MATKEEVTEALGVLAFGYLGEKRLSAAAISEALANYEGRKVLAEKSHAVGVSALGGYVRLWDEIDLTVIDTFRQAFPCPVGFSDHSDGIVIPLAAAGRGAVMIEKHLTLDRNMPVRVDIALPL